MTTTVASRIRKRQVCGALMAIVLHGENANQVIRKQNSAIFTSKIHDKSQHFTTSTNSLVCTIIPSHIPGIDFPAVHLAHMINH